MSNNNNAPAAGASIPSAIVATSTQINTISAEAALREVSLGGLKRIGIADTLNRPCPECEHILPGLLRGMVGAIAGPGAAGKTMLQLQIVFDFALGLAPLGGLFPTPPRPYRVALISGEETELTLARRLHKILDDHLDQVQSDKRQSTRQEYIAELDRQVSIFPASGVNFTLIRRGDRTEMLSTLRKIIDGHDLVFLETVSRLHDGDENSATDMAAVVNAAEWLAKRGPSIVLTHHTSKYAAVGGLNDSAAAARGSSAFVDNIRWLANLFVMSKDEAAECGIGDDMRKTFVRFEVTKANHAPPSPAKWLRRGEGGVLRLAPSMVKPAEGKKRSKKDASSQGMQYGF